MKLNMLIILLLIALVSSSCSLYFEEHFFLPSERISEDDILGIWDMYEKKESPPRSDEEHSKLIITRNNDETLNVVFKRIQRQGANVDIIPFIGKTYRFKDKKFLTIWGLRPSECVKDV